jgi:hypothetical protein
MDKQENRVAAILAANLNPLIDAANFDVHCFLNSVGGLNRQGFCVDVLAIGAKAEPKADHKN